MATKKAKKKSVRTAVVRAIDTGKEAHQIALMLLLIGNKAQTYFLQPYDAGTYGASIFGVNGVSAAVFQAAQAAYDRKTPGGIQDFSYLVDALAGFQSQMSIIGGKVQGQDDPYPPTDPCPFYDGTMKSPSVMKLTV
jgi:hypothetical protein